MSRDVRARIGRSALRAALAGAILALVAVALAACGEARVTRPPLFASRPDLAPPPLRIVGETACCVFLAPKYRGGQSGPMILDGRGRLVWFDPLPRGTTANDFKLQQYRGRPVLTWWEGRMNARGYGQGEWVIADRSYREIARVRAGNGLKGDLHDMQLTDSGTALITIYHVTDTDLSAVGGSAAGRAVDSIVQEVEVATGTVRFEWHSIGRVALTESRVGVPTRPDIPFDYFHINSIDVDRDGNLLVSARNTWAIYKIDHRTGRVLWRLGGRRSDFALGPGARFAWQHDARRQRDGTLTLFDNESTPKIGNRSRLLTLRVDHKHHRATVVRALAHPAGILAGAEGNSQQLADGAVFAGWGLGRRVSEHDATGKLTFDLRLPRTYDTYRAFRFLGAAQARIEREPRRVVLGRVAVDGISNSIRARFTSSHVALRRASVPDRPPGELRAR